MTENDEQVDRYLRMRGWVKDACGWWSSPFGYGRDEALQLAKEASHADALYWNEVDEEGPRWERLDKYILQFEPHLKTGQYPYGSGKVVRKFLDEYHYATGRTNPFIQSELPDAPNFPIVQMPREALVKFRNDYFLMIKFAAYVCGKPLEELCPFDLLAPFLRDAMVAGQAERGQ